MRRPERVYRPALRQRRRPITIATARARRQHPAARHPGALPAAAERTGGGAAYRHRQQRCEPAVLLPVPVGAVSTWAHSASSASWNRGAAAAGDVVPVYPSRGWRPRRRTVRVLRRRNSTAGAPSDRPAPGTDAARQRVARFDRAAAAIRVFLDHVVIGRGRILSSGRTLTPISAMGSEPCRAGDLTACAALCWPQPADGGDPAHHGGGLR